MLILNVMCKKIKSSGKSSDRGDNALYTKKYRDHIPCSYAYNVVCVKDKFSKSMFLYRRKNAVSKWINSFFLLIVKQFLKSMIIATKKKIKWNSYVCGS